MPHVKHAVIYCSRVWNMIDNYLLIYISFCSNQFYIIIRCFPYYVWKRIFKIDF